MNFALWRRRTFLFATYAAVLMALTIFPSEDSTQLLWLPLAFSIFGALILVWIEEMMSARNRWRLIETVELGGENDRLGGRACDYFGSTSFSDMAHDPAQGPAPTNLQTTVLCGLAYALFLLAFRYFFRNFYFATTGQWAPQFPIIVFLLYHIFWMTRRIAFDNSGITIRALRRKSAFIPWSDIAAIELWKIPASRFSISTTLALVMRDANGTALSCVQTIVLDEYEERKAMALMQTAAPLTSTRS